MDSLRQRFGRLDRDGRGFERTARPASAWIIGPKSVVGAKTPDPIYGEAVKATWEELTRLEEAGPIDVGASSLRSFPAAANAPRDHAPLLLKTHLDAWVQTNPQPLVQPDIVHFLHGSQTVPTPDVFIAWRWDRSAATLRLVPPRQAEYLAVPIQAAKAWLLGDSEVEVADVPHADGGNGSPALSTATDDWVRWAGHDGGTEAVDVADIAPGDIIVVDPTKSGLTAGTWDPGSSSPVEDLGDAAQIAYGRRATLRLDARLPYVEAPPTPSDESEMATPADERVLDWLQEVSVRSGLAGWLDETVERLRHNFVVDVDGARRLLRIDSEEPPNREPRCRCQRNGRGRTRPVP